MSSLSDLPNISKVIEGKLIVAGIETLDQLKALGSKEAFVKIRLNDPTACINMLYGLEGAIQGIRWYALPHETKEELKIFFKTLS